VGSLELKNRIAMAPMTRARSPGRAPSELTVEYYAQRAGAGLLITEATSVSQQGTGGINTPGIYTDEHIEAWRKVCDEVHARGGKIMLQLWHVGRVSHNCFQVDEQPPVAPSAIRGDVNTFTENGFEPTSEPRALTLEEIPGIVEDFAQGARNAMAAGFDGVQVHAANGYLLEQFMCDGVNQRDDEYGGSIENRCRFMLEVVDAVCDAVGSDKVSVRQSPFSMTWDCLDSDPKPLYTYAAKELSKRNLAFLEIVERAMMDTVAGTQKDVDGFGPNDIREAYEGALMVNGSYEADSADAAIASGHAQAVAFGRPFISTADVAERFAAGRALNEDIDMGFWYGGTEPEGYVIPVD
jgi:N-ethylmaleimide reductase